MKQSKANSSKLYQPYFNHHYNTNRNRNQWLFLWITLVERRLFPGPCGHHSSWWFKLKVTCLEEFGSLVGARLKFLRKSRPLRLFYEKMLIISSFSSNVDPHFNNLVDNLKGGIWDPAARADASCCSSRCVDWRTSRELRSFTLQCSIYKLPIKQRR